MLIQKSIKLPAVVASAVALFESFVNSEEYQTCLFCLLRVFEFESFVNSEEYQTAEIVILTRTRV